MELTDLSKISKETFKPYLNQQLHLVFADGLVPAELTEIVEMDTYSPLERQSFYIMIRIDLEFPLFNQGIYRLNFADQIHLDVFIVPIGPDSQGQRYQIIFS